MEEVSCDLCKNKFKRKLSQISYSENHYCSSTCYNKAKRLGVYTKCANCHEPIYKTLKAVKISKNKKFFCSRQCNNIVLGQIYSRHNHPNWKGGEYSYKEYMNKQKVKKDCAMCNISIKSVLVVHHIDKNRKNNNLGNLIWLCRNCHFLVHHYQEESNKLKICLEQIA